MRRTLLLLLCFGVVGNWYRAIELVLLKGRWCADKRRLEWGETGCLVGLASSLTSLALFFLARLVGSLKAPFIERGESGVYINLSNLRKLVNLYKCKSRAPVHGILLQLTKGQS